MKAKEKEEKVIEKKAVDQLITAWKKEYKKIFSTVICGDEYIWRRITRKEYANVMSLKEGDTLEDRIVNRQIQILKTVILNIEESELEERVNDVEGIIFSLSDEVLYRSGFILEDTKEL